MAKHAKNWPHLTSSAAVPLSGCAREVITTIRRSQSFGVETGVRTLNTHSVHTQASTAAAKHLTSANTGHF